MNFLVYKPIFQIGILLYVLSVLDLFYDFQVIAELNEKEVSIVTTKNESISVIGDVLNQRTPVKIIRSNLIGTRKRRRKRKKKSRNLYRYTTAATWLQTKSSILMANYLNDTLLSTKRPRRKKNKSRRKHGKANNKKSRMVPEMSTTSKSKDTSLLKDPYTPLKTKSLVLPVIPTQKPIKTNELGTKRVFKKVFFKTRCSKNNGGCNHLCLPKGEEKCRCFKGFRLAEDKKNCIDVNECSLNDHGCQMNCTNTMGSYRCHCPRGLRLSVDLKSCIDVNECLLRNGHGPCQDKCENAFGGYKCSCIGLVGTKLGSDSHSCIDVDECSQDNGGCSHICINTFGRLFCSCPEGLELSSDFKTCQDINECDSDHIKTSCPNGCINTEGSYRCAEISELQNDESYSQVACKPLFPPKHGYFKCSRKHSVVSYAKSGRRRVRNSLGTKCILVCPEGFKRIGRRFRISCGLGGQWYGNMDSTCVPLRHDVVQSFFQ